ncbi:MAG TPA: chitinase [Bacteroidetes bacterium]|nr:chitinase [Bacteroidota bacterium]
MNKKTFFLPISLFVLILISGISSAQLPNPALVGYWHNWNDAGAPYIQLTSVDSRYNVIEISFATPVSGTDYNMQFAPDQVTQATLISQIQTMQSQGKKILISMGGATSAISLDNANEKSGFISSMNSIINTYNFDGIDIDFEGSSVTVSGGTISNPTDAKILNLIDAIKQIMLNYRNVHNKKLLLTMAPETAFVQGGMSAYGGIWGAYLPVINSLRDSLDLLQVQLYNSGSMYGIDGNIYTQGTADFIISQTEAVIHGFNTSGGMFNGLPASKIAVGLPACSQAAGGGYTDTAIVKDAIDYLRGTGPRPGAYTLSLAGGYPALRGMMTWSVNWDAVGSCNGVYSYAENYQRIFSPANVCSPCPKPTNLSSSVINASSVVLSWTVNSCAVGYQVLYRKTGTTTWSNKNINSNTGTTTLTGLTASTSYQWRVRSKCSVSPVVWSALATVKTFTTPAIRNETENKNFIINIFPNPANDIIYINLPDNSFPGVLKIFNSIGQELLIVNVKSIDQQKISLNVSHLAPDIYFAIYLSDEKYLNQKFIIER